MFAGVVQFSKKKKRLMPDGSEHINGALQAHHGILKKAAVAVGNQHEGNISSPTKSSRVNFSPEVSVVPPTPGPSSALDGIDEDHVAHSPETCSAAPVLCDNLVSNSSNTFYFPSPSSDGLQVTFTNTIWAFYSPTHITVAKILLLAYYIVGIMFPTLTTVGFPLANVVPGACKDELYHFYYSYGFFGVLLCVVFPLWGISFFGHMLAAMQQGLPPFVEPYDKEKSVAVGVAAVGLFGTALYGLDVAPPVDNTHPSSCDKADQLVRFSSLMFVLSTVVVACVHIAHYKVLEGARQKFQERQRSQLYSVT